MTATTFRSDVVAGLWGLLTGFVAANPTMLNAGYRARPRSLGNRPLGFVGPRNEPTITHTSGLRQRNMTPSIVLVWGWNEEEETADVRDDVVDAFLDYATARPNAVSAGTQTAPTSTEDVELEMDGAYYPATIIAFGETTILEGRQ